MGIFDDDGNYDYDFHKDEVDEEVDYENIDAYNEYKEKNDDDGDDGIGCLPIILALIIIGGIVCIF